MDEVVPNCHKITVISMKYTRDFVYYQKGICMTPKIKELFRLADAARKKWESGKITVAECDKRLKSIFRQIDVHLRIQRIGSLYPIGAN